MAWRYIGTEQWYMTLASQLASSMVVCPLSLITRVGPAHHHFRILKMAKIDFKVIADPKKVEAVSFRWRSPDWLAGILSTNLSSSEFGLVLETL